MQRHITNFGRRERLNELWHTYSRGYYPVVKDNDRTACLLTSIPCLQRISEVIRSQL
jgi:hypothetical protein